MVTHEPEVADFSTRKLLFVMVRLQEIPQKVFELIKGGL